MNKAFLAGGLGADPELKYTNSGTAVLRLRMATDYRIKVGEQWENRPDWHTVIVWGKRGEALSKLLKKGSKVTVEGRITTRSWDGNDGTRHCATEIIADDVFLGGSAHGGGQQQSGQRQRRDDYAPDSSDDVPF